MKNYKFTDSQFMSAAEKLRVLKAWITFLKYGCKDEHFTKALYDHLIQHCSFIAHYNRGGFYATYFMSGDCRRRVLSQFDQRGTCYSVEYGSDHWRTMPEYKDINNALISEAVPFIPDLLEDARNSQREADVAEAKKLLARHGITIDVK